VFPIPQGLLQLSVPQPLLAGQDIAGLHTQLPAEQAPLDPLEVVHESPFPQDLGLAGHAVPLPDGSVVTVNVCSQFDEHALHVPAQLILGIVQVPLEHTPLDPPEVVHEVPSGQDLGLAGHAVPLPDGAVVTINVSWQLEHEPHVPAQLILGALQVPPEHCPIDPLEVVHEAPSAQDLGLAGHAVPLPDGSVVTVNVSWQFDEHALHTPPQLILEVLQVPLEHIPFDPLEVVHEVPSPQD